MKIRYLLFAFCLYGSAALADGVLRDTDTLHMSFREIVNSSMLEEKVSVAMELCGARVSAGTVDTNITCTKLADSDGVVVAAKPEGTNHMVATPATNSPPIPGKRVNDLATQIAKTLNTPIAQVAYSIEIKMFESGADGKLQLLDRQFSKFPQLSQEPDQTKRLQNRHVLNAADKHMQSRVLIVVTRTTNQ
jgi:hypothetical protein